MARIVFVTGTDTGVGKTYVTVALMQALRARGEHVLGMKPVAAGCRSTPAGLRNTDALALQRAASIRLDYPSVNPYALAPAIAPHIAAQQAGAVIDIEALSQAARRLAGQTDKLLVEGAGGWLVPLDETSTMADLAVRLAADVLLVVGLRLGCINHALLTAAAIQASGLRLIGWVGNAIDPTAEAVEANVRTLEARLPAPCVGLLPNSGGPDAAAAARHLDVDILDR